MLGERVIASEGSISLTDLGEGENRALLCVTDNRDCCNNATGTQGRWNFPNDSAISSTRAAGGDLYISRGEGVVRLNRRNNATIPTGRYCCEVPNFSSIMTTTCVSLVMDST